MSQEFVGPLTVTSAQGVQGGSLELGATLGGAPETPYVDFHFGLGAAQDFNVRLINTADNRLDVVTALGGTVLSVQGDKIGIGTLSPATKLVVNELAGGAEVRVDGLNGTVGLSLGADATQQPWVGTRTNHALRLLTNNTEKMRVQADGHVGIGNTNPDHVLVVGPPSSGRHLVVNDVPTARWGLATGNFNFAIQNDGSGTWETRLLLTRNGNVGIGTVNPQGTLDVNGAIRAGTSDLYFTNTTHNHTGIGNTAGFAAIENSANYNTLMILGRSVSTSPLRRSVSVWDELHVYGPVVTHRSHTIKIGVVSPANPPRYGNDGIRGEPNLWLDAANTVFIKQGFQAVGGFDIAERFKIVGQVDAGQVVVFDAQEEAVTLCDHAYDGRVIGIASAEPAFILGMDQAQMPIALCGRVPCNVDADIAPIAVGDLLTTSPTSGHAQKVLDRGMATGAILGKALGSLDRGKGQIPVLVMLR
jgi:hypothetical protein